jgi:hypothetical protein
MKQNIKICMSDIDNTLNDEMIKIATTVFHKVPLSNIRKTFCFSLNNHLLNINNINNNKIQLITFTNIKSKLLFNISTLKSIENINIPKDFIKSYIKKTNIQYNNYKNIENFIESKYLAKLTNDKLHFKNNSKLIGDNNSYNSTCLKLLKQIIILSPERIKYINNDKYHNIHSIPLIIGDIIYFYSLLNYGSYKKLYKINIILY